MVTQVLQGSEYSYEPVNKWFHEEEGKETLAGAALVAQVQPGLGSSSLGDMKAHNPWRASRRNPGPNTAEAGQPWWAVVSSAVQMHLAIHTCSTPPHRPPDLRGAAGGAAAAPPPWLGDRLII